MFLGILTSLFFIPCTKFLPNDASLCFNGGLTALLFFHLLNGFLSSYLLHLPLFFTLSFLSFNKSFFSFFKSFKFSFLFFLASRPALPLLEVLDKSFFASTISFLFVNKFFKSLYSDALKYTPDKPDITVGHSLVSHSVLSAEITGILPSSSRHMSALQNLHP